MSDFRVLLALIFLISLAFWQRDIVIYFVAGVATMIGALDWVPDYPAIGISLMFLAAYLMLLGLLRALASDKPTRGWSQFKGLYTKIRGWF